MRLLVAATCLAFGPPAWGFTTLYECPNAWPQAVAEYQVSDDVTSLNDVAASVDDLRAVYRRAFATWSSPCCTRFEARELGTTAASALDTTDDVNALTILVDEWPVALGDPQSTIGVTIVSVDEGCAITGADTLFNAANFTFTNGGVDGTVDFEAVAVHELGHFLGLGHTNVAGATMAPADQSVDVRTLHPDDEDGVCTLYPRRCRCNLKLDCPADYDCTDGFCERGQPPPPPQECPFNPECPVCSPCASDEDCAPNGVCLLGPNVCTRECTVDDDCPGDTICLLVPLPGEEQLLCFNPDAPTNGACPDGYVCGGECAAPVVDAGPAPTTAPPPDDVVGCTCSEARGGAAWFGLFVLALRSRRLRR